jgi:hypothetical protein
VAKADVVQYIPYENSIALLHGQHLHNLYHVSGGAVEYPPQGSKGHLPVNFVGPILTQCLSESFNPLRERAANEEAPKEEAPEEEALKDEAIERLRHLYIS